MSNRLNSHDWREYIPPPLSRTDLNKFQSELDAIVGVEDSGVKRWRIVWGSDLDVASVWNRYSREWMPRYPADFTRDYVANPATGILELKKTWYGIPRYFIEALIPRVHRNEEAEASGLDPDGEVFTERRLADPEYVTMFCVAQHHQKMTDGWRTCCLYRVRKGQTCYGNYRPPDEKDIEMLREDYHRRVTSKMCRPDEKPTAADKTLFYYSWMLDQMREAKRRSDELDCSRRHILSTLIHWPGTSFDSKKNRFSIPGANN